MNSRINISINFGDIILPVVKCVDGLDRVPLKHICDLIGVNWTTQKDKLQAGSYLNQRLGAEYQPLKGSVLSPKGGNPNHICIRIDRVTAFLNTLNPSKIRGMGNNEAADWLEAKHAEWDNVLHEYENSIDGIFGKTQSNNIKALTDLCKLRDKSQNMKEKAALTQMVQAQFKAMGVDLEDLQSPQSEMSL